MPSLVYLPSLSRYVLLALYWDNDCVSWCCYFLRVSFPRQPLIFMDIVRTILGIFCMSDPTKNKPSHIGPHPSYATLLFFESNITTKVGSVHLLNFKNITYKNNNGK